MDDDPAHTQRVLDDLHRSIVDRLTGKAPPLPLSKDASIRRLSLMMPVTEEQLIDVGLLPAPPYEPPPPLPLRYRVRQLVSGVWWFVRWWLAEKLAGEKIHSASECPDWDD